MKKIYDRTEELGQLIVKGCFLYWVMMWGRSKNMNEVSNSSFYAVFFVGSMLSEHGSKLKAKIWIVSVIIRIPVS